MVAESEKILVEAQKLYDEGKWGEAVVLLDKIEHIGFEDCRVEDYTEALRLYGWCYYYLGTKGPAEEKAKTLNYSRRSFELVLAATSNAKKRISALNGLPLSLWILDEKNAAWEVSDRATKEFLDEPSVWNTRAILCRWAKDFEKSIEVCEKVYKTALIKREYRTAGHGKQNRADALKELNRGAEAKIDYARAIELYRCFELDSGQSAQFHIEGVRKKISAL